jgi:oxygen-independent coproporphyrinogen-3 oxidase
MRYLPQLLDALHKELAQRTQGEIFDTIYIGGGTPSLLSDAQLGSLLQSFRVSDNVEITLEVNPDDVTTEKLTAWKLSGINRLSVGVQSFRDQDLFAMGRAHTAEQARYALSSISNAEFDSWTMDLMYGLPDQGLDDWRNNIEEALEFAPPHISAYCLTIEAGTVLHHQVSSGSVSVPDDHVQAQQLEILTSVLGDQEYLHYEVSNFAKEGHLAKHNTNYWKRLPYIGIGPSAHSFNGSTRRWNISNNGQYIRSLNNAEVYWEEEEIDDRAATNEMIMTGLRTQWGIDPQALPITLTNQQQKTVQRYISSGSLLIQQDRLVLTAEGRMIADRIASDLFIIE